MTAKNRCRTWHWIRNGELETRNRDSGKGLFTNGTGVSVDEGHESGGGDGRARRVELNRPDAVLNRKNLRHLTHYLVMLGSGRF